MGAYDSLIPRFARVSKSIVSICDIQSSLDVIWFSLQIFRSIRGLLALMLSLRSSRIVAGQSFALELALLSFQADLRGEPL
jgi:hypothetical protein